MLMTAGVLPSEADWLERLAETAIRPATGAVAPKTLYADGRIRHAGMAVGFGDPFGYVARLTCSGAAGPDAGSVTIPRLDALSEVSFVSRHCMLLRRTVFDDVGGLAEHLDRETGDVDLSARLRGAGPLRPGGWPRGHGAACLASTLGTEHPRARATGLEAAPWRSVRAERPVLGCRRGNTRTVWPGRPPRGRRASRHCATGSSPVPLRAASTADRSNGHIIDDQTSLLFLPPDLSS